MPLCLTLRPILLFGRRCSVISTTFAASICGPVIRKAYSSISRRSAPSFLLRSSGWYPPETTNRTRRWLPRLFKNHRLFRRASCRLERKHGRGGCPRTAVRSQAYKGRGYACSPRKRGSPGRKAVLQDSYQLVTEKDIKAPDRDDPSFKEALKILPDCDIYEKVTE